METAWGGVIFSDADEGKFPVITYDKYRQKALRTKADDMNKRIEIYTKERANL